MADAELIISTGLDLEGINKGTKEVSEKMRNLTKALDEQQKAVERQKKTVQELQKELKAIPKGELASPEDIKNAETLSGKLALATEELDKSKLVAEQLKDQLKAIGDISTKLFTPEETAELRDIAAEAKKYSGTLDDIIQKEDNVRSLTSEFNKQANEIIKAEAELKKMKTQLEALGAQEDLRKQQEAVTAEIKKQEQAYQDLIAQNEALNRQLESATAKKEITRISGEIRTLDKELLKTGETLDSLYRKSEKVATALSLDPTATAEYIALSDKIKTTEESLSGAKVEANETKNRIAELLAIKDTSTGNTVERINTSMTKLNGLLTTVRTATKSVLSVFGNVFGKMQSIVSKFTGKAIGSFRLFAKETHRTNNVFDKMGKRILSLAATVFVFDVIRKAMRALTETTGNLLTANEQYNASLNSIKVNLWTAFAPIWEVIEPALLSLMNTLAQVVQFTAQLIAMAFGKTYQQAKDSGKALSEQAKGLDKVAGSAKKAAGQMSSLDELATIAQEADTGEDIAATLDFEAVQEQDFTWIDELKKKIDELYPDLEFFYAFGQMIAEAINEGMSKIDWAKIQATAKEIAEKFANFLNGFIAGLDWGLLGKTISEGINTILSFVSKFINTFDWRNLGNALAAGLNGFIENLNWNTFGETIANSFNSVFNTLRGFIDKFDWSNFGLSLANGFQSLTDSIEWEFIGETLGKGINGLLTSIYTFYATYDWQNLGMQIASLLNTMIETIDWVLLGETLASILNAAINVLYGFIAEFDWANLGLSLAIGLQSLTDFIDWNLMGEMLADGINGILNFIYIFFTTYDWGSLGNQIANGLNDMIFNLDWDLLGRTLASKWTALVDFLYDFVTTFEWADFGAQIAIAVNAWFDEIDWGKAGKTISTGILGLIETLRTFIAEVDWQQIGKDIQEFLVNINWGGIVTEAFKTLGSAFAGLGLFLIGLFEDAISGIGEYFNDIFVEMGDGDVIGALLVGITMGLANIGIWIYDNILKPFVDGFKEMFQIHSPSKVMEELGKFIIEGLLEGISSLINKAVEIFQELWNNIQEIFTPVAQWFDDNIIQPIIKLFDDLVISIKEFFQGVLDFFTGIFTGDWEKAWDGISKVFETVFGGVEDIAKGVINSVIDLINGMTQAISSGVNFMINSINKLSFDVPDWVPIIGGKSFGFNLPTVSIPQIPRLATGAVLPPNRPFMAMVGDQTHGTNIEAPLDTIKQALAEVLANNNNSETNLLLQGVIDAIRGLTITQSIESGELLAMVKGAEGNYGVQTGGGGFQFAR